VQGTSSPLVAVDRADGVVALTGVRVLTLIEGRCDWGGLSVADAGVAVPAVGIGAALELVRAGCVQPVTDVAVAASAATTVQIRPRISVHPIVSTL
jgi:hypothetical protein